MTTDTDRRGILVFLIIVGIFLAVAVIVYIMTGSMGIEERFENAVGISGGNATGSGSFFPIEGDPLLYFLILGILGAGAGLLYWRGRD